MKPEKKTNKQTNEYQMQRIYYAVKMQLLKAIK